MPDCLGDKLVIIRYVSPTRTLSLVYQHNDRWMSSGVIFTRGAIF